MRRTGTTRARVSDRDARSLGGARHGVRALAAAFVLACAVTLASAGVAAAAAQIKLNVSHGPTNLAPGGKGQYVVVPQNVGDDWALPAVFGGPAPIALEIELPVGATATRTSSLFSVWSCTGPGGDPVEGASTLSCQLGYPIFDPFDGDADGAPNANRGAAMALLVYVEVASDAQLGVRDAIFRMTSAGGATLPDGSACGEAPDPPCATAVEPTAIDTATNAFGVAPGGFAFGAYDRPGLDARRTSLAGSHPSEVRVDVDFRLGYFDDELGEYTRPLGNVRTLEMKLPRGFIGNPEATPKCSLARLLKLAPNPSLNPTCPSASQVGSADLWLQNAAYLYSGNWPNQALDYPLYNMEPPKGAVAAFGFAYLGQTGLIVASLDPTDNYSVVTKIHYTNSMFALRGVSIRIWGVPADPIHYRNRWNPDTGERGAPGASRTLPFLTLPSACGVPLAASMRADSWQSPGQRIAAEAEPMTVTGCDAQRLDASMNAQLTNGGTDAPTGLTMDLSVRQDMSPYGRGTPPLRKAVVRLPAGMSVSPSAAAGLQACSPAQIGLGTDDEPTCPDASRIGTVTIDTPLLAKPLSGEVYIATQNDNPFGTLFAMYVVARTDGVLVKLAGRVDLDPVTGQMTATFDNTPEVPFSNMRIELKGGSRAPLATPTACGTYTTSAELTSWNASLAPVTVSSSFTVTRPDCSARFAPKMSAGTVNPVAGAASPFTLTLTRDDDDDFLKGMQMQTPKGLTGTIANVDLCAEANAASGTCPESSRVGKVTAGAGPGPNPFFIDGRVYMTGPYKGAPFGLSILLPAKAGPFDLGIVNVRAALFVDRHTAELRVVSDPLPTIIEGIPLRARSVNVTLDRPGFVINPTNCDPKRVTGTITSEHGMTADVSDHFQAADCGALPFRPRMSMRGGARGKIRKGRITPLTATLTMPPGNANIALVDVTLPYALNARLTVVNDACTRAEYDAGNCDKARIGTAVAHTPLLREPLTGAAYFVKRAGESLPDIVVAMRGQVDFDLVGQVRIPGGTRLGTRFTTVPDVPISQFTLSLISGRRGSVGNAENLCRARRVHRRAHVRFVGQNGKVSTVRPFMKVDGCARVKSRRGKSKSRQRSRAARASSKALAQAKAAARRDARS